MQPSVWPTEPLESVILRRGSARRFDVSRSLTFEELSTALAVATTSIPADFTEDPESSLLDLYVIAHAVEGLRSAAPSDGAPLRGVSKLYCDPLIAADFNFLLGDEQDPMRWQSGPLEAAAEDR